MRKDAGHGGSCHRGLLNHDIYTDFESDEDFTTWARDTTGDNTFEAVDYSFEEEINKDRDGWELGLHQGRLEHEACNALHGIELLCCFDFQR